MSRAYILDRDTLATVGLVDQSYASITYKRRYQATDTFELVINRKRLYASEIRKGRVLFLPDEGNRVFLIEQIQLTQSGQRSKDEMTVSGRSLEGIAMAERLAMPSPGQSHDELTDVPAETAIKHYVDVNAVTTVDPDRALANLEIASDMARGIDVSTAARYQYVLDFVQEIGFLSGLGWEIVLDRTDPDNPVFVFDVIEGVDRSASVFFDFAFETLERWDEVDSDLDSKTLALVAGQGEGVDRDIEVRGGGTGFDRREAFIDARDVEQGNTDLLDARGDAFLAEATGGVALEATIHQFGSFRYLTHWDMGDIVLVRNEERGIEYASRVVEVAVTINKSPAAPTIVATLGRPFPTLRSRTAGGSAGTADGVGSAIDPQDEIILDVANEDVRLYRAAALTLGLDDNNGGAAGVSLRMGGELWVRKVSGTTAIAVDSDPTRTSLFKFLIQSSGQLTWGAGGATRDLQIKRNAAGEMYIDSNAQAVATDVKVNGSSGQGALLSAVAGSGSFSVVRAYVSGDTAERASINHDSSLKLGSGGGTPDVRLYRSGARSLVFDPNGVAGATYFTVHGNSGADTGIVWERTGDSVAPMAVVTGTGTAPEISMGSGAATRDTRIFRAAAGQVQIDSLSASATTRLTLEATAGQRVLLDMRQAGDTQSRLALDGATSNSTFISLGPGGSTSRDVFLGRVGTKNLQVDANGGGTDLTELSIYAGITDIKSNGGKTTLKLSNTTANVGITVGGDTNLYRDAANSWKTDDSLNVAGTMTWGTLASAHKRWRYVPLAGGTYVHFSAQASVGPTGATIELTGVPANTAVAVSGVMGIRRTDTNNVALSLTDLNGEALQQVFSSGVASRGGFCNYGPLPVGGTNQRQIKYSSTTATTDSVYIYVTGYWVIED